MVQPGEFYQQILQAEAEGDETHVRFFVDGAGLTAFDASGMEGLASGSMQDAGSGNCVIEIEVDDVDREYERLKARNVAFVKLPTTHPWGRRSMWFRDPDGNLVNFYTGLNGK